jgi:hypothetical protein
MLSPTGGPRGVHSRFIHHPTLFLLVQWMPIRKGIYLDYASIPFSLCFLIADGCNARARAPPSGGYEISLAFDRKKIDWFPRLHAPLLPPSCDKLDQSGARSVASKVRSIVRFGRDARIVTQGDNFVVKGRDYDGDARSHWST